MLTNHQRGARAGHARRTKIIRLCWRVDHYVELAERWPKHGKTRARYMALADRAREQLRILDH